jgi:hypothetical protein
VIGARQAWVMQLMSNDERPLFALEIGNLNVSSGSIAPLRRSREQPFDQLGAANGPIPSGVADRPLGRVAWGSTRGATNASIRSELLLGG